MQEIPAVRAENAISPSEEIALEIQRRLRSAGHPNLRHIQCEYRDGVVVLRGRVSSYYAKQLAQSVLLVDPAVNNIENLIEVAVVQLNGRHNPRAAEG
jgi:osmotically-inducible protein OsmY